MLLENVAFFFRATTDSVSVDSGSVSEPCKSYALLAFLIQKKDNFYHSLHGVNCELLHLVDFSVCVVSS